MNPNDLKDDTTEDTSGEPQNKPAAQTPESSPEFEKALSARVDAELAKIKENLDKAYGARDTAQAELAKAREELRKVEIAALEKEGKHVEALQLQLKEANESNTLLRQANLGLTRDSQLRVELGAYGFRNDRAMELAIREITPQLVSDDSGAWVHKSGVSLADSVKAFCEDQNNSFLFKAKANTGGGSDPRSVGTQPGEQKRLSQLSQNEVLELARQGKLPRR